VQLATQEVVVEQLQHCPEQVVEANQEFGSQSWASLVLRLEREVERRPMGMVEQLVGHAEELPEEVASSRL